MYKAKSQLPCDTKEGVGIDLEFPSTFFLISSPLNTINKRAWLMYFQD